MKKTKTTMKMTRDYEKEFIVKGYKILPVVINVKGFMILEDVDRIIDQITKSVECSDALLNKTEENSLKPDNGQFAWVEIDDCGLLEMARYVENGNRWADFGTDPGLLEGNRVRVHKLIQTPKL